jgi:O-antigen biosynthesis protein
LGERARAVGALGGSVSSSDGPLVTVMLTSYNYGAYVGEAIRSALGQTYRNVEVLVLDNASTDDSREVIASFSDERLRVILHPENIGLWANYVEAVRLARGQFVLWLSADDVLLPTLIEDVLEYRRLHPGVEVVYASVAIIDAQGKIVSYFEHPSFDGADTFIGRNELANLLTRDSSMYLPTVLFERRFFDELGPLDRSLEIASDYEYEVRLAAAGKTFGFFAKPEVLIRNHGENRSGSELFVRTGGQLREFCTILETYTQPSYHERLAGYGAELRAMVARKVTEIQAQFPEDYSQRRSELEPYVARALASIDTVPAVGPAVLRGQGLVSVILPFTGRVGPLQRALESLAAQRYSNWEAVVVSDGAIDPGGIIAGIGLTDRVRVARSRRDARGPSAARNIGLGCVNGEIVAYLDEDNRLDDGYLGALAANFKDPAVMVTLGRWRIAVVAPNGDILRVADPGAIEGGVSLTSNRVPLNAVAHRRSCVAQAGTFHRGLSVLEDWEFLLRLSRKFPLRLLDVPAATLCIEVSMNGHHLYGRRTSGEWTEFVAKLQDVYAGYPPPSEAERAARAAYTGSLQELVGRGLRGIGNPDEVAAFAMGLAGVAAAGVTIR